MSLAVEGGEPHTWGVYKQFKSKDDRIAQACDRAMIVALLYALTQRDLKRGVAALRIGGEATAIAIEQVT
jgi:hypothetical protein